VGKFENDLRWPVTAVLLDPDCTVGKPLLVEQLGNNSDNIRALVT
jgi:hypothetical protein